MLFYLGKSYLTACSNMLTPALCLQTVDWEVELIDQDSVPVSVAGVVIRPVDLAAIKRIARAAKGAIKIPGIRIKEVQTTVLRT